ncbi:hypothetical protein [Chryseobacterium phocaeense]|uniref:hypothetical protein n=1 Tax=Chryseobacterium phocaeense TaxID=1816690 RepID=UPI0009BAFF07|nr:hypothetical protein [Chryseobacterium phocaeense]
MENFVTDKKEFEHYKSKIKKLFPEYLSFEKNSFNSNFKYFIAFDFDYIFEEIFFEGVIAFLNNIKNEKLFFYTIDPSPEDYFFLHFNKYSVFELEINKNYDDFNNIIYKDPGENTADAIGINSNEISCFSNSNDWAIMGSREWEIAIVGFTSLEMKEKFLISFKDNSDIFTSVEQQIDILDDLLNFDNELKSDYKKLIENYQDRA